MIYLAAFLLLVLYIFLGVKKPGLALITCPIPLIATMVCCGSMIEMHVFAVVIGVVIIVVTVTIIFLRAIRSDVEDTWPQIWCKIIVWVAGLVGLLVVFLGVLRPLGLVFWVAFVISLIHYKTTSARAGTMHVISTIGAGIRQNLPLATALEAAAANRKDKRAQILRRISKWLVQGYSLSEAIKKGYPKCPSDVIATISAAEKINQLPQAIKSIEENLIERADSSRRIEPVSPVYPAVVLLIVTLILFFLMMKIVPVFAQVLDDMSEGEVELPKSTTFLLNLTDSLLGNQLLLAGLVVFLFIGGCVLVYARFRSRRPEKPYLVSRITDFVKWHLPVMHWFEFNYSMLRLVGLLRVSLNAGCTVNDSIRSSLGLDVNSCFRRRISNWLKRVERGDDISSAAQKSKMGNALVWAFDDKVNQDNTPAILEMLEEFYRSNYSYKVNLARFILEPCTILMLGLIVGFVVHAIFTPMITIVNHLADTAMP